MTEGLRTAATQGVTHDAACADETPHAMLRRVTRPWHDEVEGAFACFDLQTLDGLAAFLLRQAAALFPLERALESADVAGYLPDWRARHRAPALAADLARLGLELPVTPDLPPLRTPFELLGALYVLEGSKLGGRVLHRRVLASSDPRVRAVVAFLGHRHDRGWPTFLALLDAVPREAPAQADLREGALLAFRTFHAAAGSDVPACFADARSHSGLYHRAHA